MGTQRNTDMSMSPDQIKKIEVEDVKQQVEADQESSQQTDDNADQQQSKDKTAAAKPKSAKKQRSKKYQAVRSKVDKTKHYDLFSAVELVKRLSYTSFEGTISAHLTVKEQGLTKTIDFPHKTGQNLQVEIADDKTLKKIEQGNIDFDVLLAAPDMMSKITKHAPILGPQGLMPNPKNNTLTPNPEQRKKELEAGKITLKTERKAPLIHIPVGKTEMETQKIVENLQALIKAFGPKLTKMTIAATMSPGVKVQLEQEYD